MIKSVSIESVFFSEDTGNSGEFFLLGDVGFDLSLVEVPSFSTLDLNSGTVIVTEVVESVPEPSSLIGLGLIGFAVLGAKRKVNR